MLHGGLETTVQEYPGRRLGRGIPRSGPMDALAFRAANILVGNAPGVEALELTLVGCQLRFHVPAVVAVTGADASVTADGAAVPMWGRICVPAGATLAVGTVAGPGLRVYVAVKGGFPEVPAYLGSKATSMGLGGYQVGPRLHTCRGRRSRRVTGPRADRGRPAGARGLRVRRQ